MAVRIKRAYEEPAASDGVRILIDALWPRGISRERLDVSEWMQGIAPSNRLRRWYGHDPAKWEKFRQRYRKELSSAAKKPLVRELAAKARRGTLTLVFAARDAEHSNAAVIAELMEGEA